MGGVGKVADGISESCVRGRYCIIVAVWGGRYGRWPYVALID